MTWTHPAGTVDSGSLWASDAEAKASFLLRLRAKGIRDLGVLRAMEAVRRADFVPHRYADLAGRQIALPIGCGQTMSEPFFVARVLEALGCTAETRVLEIGAGSGYVTALLARLSREVLALERFQSLAVEARARLAGLAITNAVVDWADGLALDNPGPFDRIVVHAALEATPVVLFDRLGQGGTMIYPRIVRREDGSVGNQTLMRAVRAGDAIEQAELFRSRLQAAQAGRSALL